MSAIELNNDKRVLSGTVCTRCNCGKLRLWHTEKEDNIIRKIYKCSNPKCFTKTIVNVKLNED